MFSTIIIIALIVTFLSIFFSFVPLGLWISALASNVKVSIFTLIGMKLRRVRPDRIIKPLIKGRKAGLNISVDELEAHYLAGGNVDSVVNALIAAERANINLEFEKATAIDLAGRNVFEAVQMYPSMTFQTSSSHPNYYCPYYIIKTIASKGLNVKLSPISTSL